MANDGEPPIDVEVIAPDGDVILHPSVRHHPKRATFKRRSEMARKKLPANRRWKGDVVQCKIRVSSAVLMKASPVFAALLGGHFREGQASRTAFAPQTIALPDDSPEPMTQMCTMLHGQTPDELLDSPSADVIFDLSRVVDKYGCAGHLRLQLEGLIFGWLQENDDSHHGMRSSLDTIATASYWIGNRHCFRIATRRAVMEYPNDGPTIESALHFLPDDVADILDYQRALVRDKFTVGIPKCLCNMPQEDCPQCGGTWRMDGLKEWFGMDSWPGTYSSVEGMVSDITKLIGFNFECDYCDRTAMESAIGSGAVQSFIAELKDLCSGLCLQCVREEKSLLRPCKIAEHKK